jgi:hypothetical protein
MTYQTALGLVSVALSAVGYGHYFTSIVRGRTKPHLFSWLVWTIVLCIVFLAQLSRGAAAGAWATGASCVACAIIAVLTLSRGEKNITASDKAALAGALLIIPVWYGTRDPLWAVLMAIAIDALAYYPTFRKSYGKPYEESVFLYNVDIVKWIVALCALGSRSATTMLYPLFLIASDAALVVMILRRRAQAQAAARSDVFKM